VIPDAVKKQAVFMAIGIGEYLIVTQHSSGMITSRNSENQRLKSLGFLKRALPDLTQIELILSSVETGALNVEALLRERPDVIVTWARLAETFERVGLPVIGLGPVSSTGRLSQNTMVFSTIFGQRELGEVMIARSLAQRLKTAEEVAGKTETKARLLWLYPLENGLWRAGSWFRELTVEAGGEDLAAFLPFQVSVNAEELLVLAPDVILLGGPSGDHMAPIKMMETKSLSAIPAIRDHRVYNTPPGIAFHMASVIELPIYLQWLAEILHPREIKPQARNLASSIYARELGIEPTEAELDELLGARANQPAIGQVVSGAKAQ